MDEKNLHRQYSRLLSNHGYGHALREPMSSEEVKPGSCGHFKSDGIWNTLFDIDDQNLFQEAGFSYCNVERAQTDSRTWGPVCSDCIKQVEFKVDAEVS